MHMNLLIIYNYQNLVTDISKVVEKISIKVTLALIQYSKHNMQGIQCICGINIDIAINAHTFSAFTLTVCISQHQFRSQIYSFVAEKINSYIDYCEINQRNT